MVTIDVSHVFGVFGGPAALLSLLDRYQPDSGLTYNAVQMWRHRGQIPSRWVALVLYIVEQEGHQCREFMTDTDEFS